MKRPEKYEHSELYPNCYVYKCTDIDPLLDRLDELEAEEIRRNTYPNKVGREAMRVTADDKWCFNPVQADKKPFPSYEEWLIVWNHYMTALGIYNYFSQFQYEKKVFPKVGDMVEGEDMEGDTFRGELKWYELHNGAVVCYDIRPATRPTREEVIDKVESKLDNNELLFDRELVKQFLEILKGQ